MRERYLKLVVCLALAACLLIPSAARAQSVVSGEVDGTVTDQTGAVAPNASVNLISTETGFNETTTTGATGTFRFALVKPGNYGLTVTLSGFSTVKRAIVVSLGQVTNVPLQLEVGKASQTVEVTAEAPLLHTENANLASTVSEKTIELVPSPGQDITNYVMTTPGVTLSTGAGYGNLTANGLPGTSNLYTVNGNDYNDPYLNLNNSGASNLLLGANELQEITVVTNGYTGEYGRMAGANVNYTTKSGSNSFHGNATWLWNGRYLNANDWFNNGGQGGTTNPRPFSNSNQWAGAVGGPIKKDKLFFFYDNEGLRYVLPGGGAPTYLPTAPFESAVTANVTANNPSAVPFYQTIFKLFDGAPGASGARPLDTNDDPALGCGSFAGTAAPGGGTFGVAGGIPCARTLRSAVNNLNTERLMSVSVDWNASANDTVKWRYKQDRGVQATGTDPINSLFNANSVQPEDDGQVLWTHIINGHTTNQFIAAGLYYSAIFGPPNINASLSLFPTTIIFNDGLLNNMGGSDFNFPQGRNVAQYQFVDDFSWTRGNHGIKFGTNFRRNNIASFAAGPLTSGEVIINNMNDFYNGVLSVAGGSQMTKRFASANDLPISYYSLGLYVQDEWRATSKLKLTLALRADRNSPEVCGKNCFARLQNPFESISHDATIPYNQVIVTGLNQAFPTLEKVVFSPRGGFAYNVVNGLVIRGGVGLFTDLYPGELADRYITNAPNVTSFTISATNANNNIPIAPGTTLNGVQDGFSQAAASNTALRNAFTNGGTLASIQALLPGFSAPNFNPVATNIKNPKYLEWNLMVEKAVGTQTSVSLNYVGNHGYDLFTNNVGLNTYCLPGNSHGCPADLPATQPDLRFSNISELRNSGYSNYDGLTVSVVRRLSHGLQGSFNYTYSHSLDTLSNGGLLPYSTNTGGDSFRIQFDPYNLRHPNYGNSDYDFRHSLSATYFYEMPFKSQNHFVNAAVGGWSIAQTFFFRTGEPFSVYRSGSSYGLKNGASETVLADYITGPTSCTDPTTACFNKAADFASSWNNFGNPARNSFRGPRYFNSDFSIFKNFKIRESGMGFTMMADAYNILNHPNFANPIDNLSSGAFGLITSTVEEPNSPYGNFQGAAVSGRVLQLGLKFKF
ncbi:MAG TPA: carboxypeptidase regulatory-like domain-containing protein [Candidatus Acidoferrum sp.]|nr:carboxypeptidase regulatory-like domain-containing protein [Candidatus Acidoferrum sp.]